MKWCQRCSSEYPDSEPECPDCKVSNAAAQALKDKEKKKYKKKKK